MQRCHRRISRFPGRDARGGWTELARLDTDVRTPPAPGVAALVAERLAGASFDAQALFALEPHYVRPSEAELKFPKGLGPGARS